MEIVKKKVKDLIPYQNNPRKNDEAVDYVAASIKEFGFKVPIIIDQNNEIVAGHTRLKAAKKLHLKEVPCIVADDLNEDQIKAFRLADNKVSEQAEWDLNLLDLELDTIKLNMEPFGFTLPKLIEPEEEKENERTRTIDAYNLADYNEKMTEGFYQMPIILKEDCIPSDLIGFNYAKTFENKEVGIHFYIDDYQFERIWNSPSEYISLLEEYECVLTPDFSLYREMPIAMMIWNVYRSRLIGQIFQRSGITVIPTVSWCQKETFAFCFDGLPKKSVLSISTIGVKRDPEAFQIWKDGVDEMIRRLDPKALLIYGGEVDYDFGKIKTVYYNNHVTERMKNVVPETTS